MHGCVTHCNYHNNKLFLSVVPNVYSDILHVIISLSLFHLTTGSVSSVSSPSSLLPVLASFRYVKQAILPDLTAFVHQIGKPVVC